jgi:aldehyde:ferredoxin oxidoreductase
MKGWTGKILFVDLTNGRTEEQPLDPKIARDYIGGRGLGIHYLNARVDPRCDPLSPENLLVMATGPLTGTGAPTGARYMVTTKSPLTGALTCANSGGFFPTELKRSGFDAVVFKGRSTAPVYLWICDGKAELRSAAGVWGKNTHETTAAVVAETDPKARVACIGPAGERQVRFAAIINDLHRAAGRSGVGAVMGAKNIKAVAVRGTGRVALADPKRFKAFNKTVMDRFRSAVKEAPLGLTVNGTAGVVVATQNFGVLPTRNWRQGTFDGWETIQGEVLTKRFLVKNSACYSCPIGCGRRTRVDDPRFAGEGEGPEYETIYALGSNCMVDSLAAITKANYLCNELGMDTITMGATIACAMELAEHGWLTSEAVGRTLEWGDAEALVALTRMTGLREGFGDQLAEGSFRLAARYGHPEVAMTSKKQEFPGYEPRGAQAMGLAYATSPIGGSHMRGDPAYPELFGIPEAIDPHEWRGKAAVTRAFQDLSAIIDASGLCIFFAVRNLAAKTLDVPPTGILEYLNAATGAGYTLETLMAAGERIITAERLFLARAGFTRKDDSLPRRLTETPAPTGPARGQVCHLEKMLDEYYALRGWTSDGIPGKALLERLGLA